jgi:hypothetical protein
MSDILPAGYVWCHWITSDEIAVNRFGHVISVRTGRERAVFKNHNGLPYIFIRSEDTGKPSTTVTIARLVGEAFVEPPNLGARFPEPDTLLYSDGDRSHVDADNLHWRPRGYAIAYHKEFDPLLTDRSPMRSDTTHWMADRRYLEHKHNEVDTLRNFAMFYGILWRHIMSFGNYVSDDPAFAGVAKGGDILDYHWSELNRRVRAPYMHYSWALMRNQDLSFERYDPPGQNSIQ